MALRSLTTRARQHVQHAQKAISLLLRHQTIKPVGTHLYDLKGVKVALDFSASLHRQIYIQNGFEPELSMLLPKITDKGDVFVDIGANIGWHTLSLLNRRQDVLFAYAYEPSKKMFELLKKGIWANRHNSQCQAKCLAISSKKGTNLLKTFVGLDPMHASVFQLADWPCEEEEVELDTLDSQAKSFKSPPTVIKCDVEGGERDVLLGATNILSGKLGDPPLWLLEANYETAGMAGFFPWELIEIAACHAPYKAYSIRNGRIVPLPNKTALRHGDTLILAIPELHHDRLKRAQ